MNEIFKKTAKEVVRIVLSALLAALGVSASGCLACGDGASVALPHSAISTK